MVERKVKVRLEAEDRASQKIAGLGKALVALGATAAAVAVAFRVGQSLVKGLTEATKAAGAFESEIVRLDQALRNSGQFTQTASNDLREFAKELQKVSVASETQILKAQAMALNMGATAEGARESAQAATNLAASIGVDLETAVRQINKTLGGYAGELGEIIPQLKDLTAAQLRAGEGARLINEKFRGAALVMADTFQGAVNNLDTAMNQLSVAIGGNLLDATKIVIQSGITPLVSAMADGAGAGNTLRDAMLGMARGVLIAELEILKLLNALDKSRESIQQLGTDLVASLLPVQQFSKLFLDAVLAVAVFNDIMDETGDTAEKTAGRLDGVIAKIEAGIERIDALLVESGQLKPPGPLVDRPLKELVPELELIDVDGIIEPVLEIEAAFQRVNDTVRVLGVDELPLVADALRESAVAADELDATFVSLSSEIKSVLVNEGVRAAFAFSDALIDAAFGAQIAWDKFFKQLLKDIAKAIVRMLILRAISALAGPVGAAAGAAAGAGAASAAGLTFDAPGGIVSTPITIGGPAAIDPGLTQAALAAASQPPVTVIVNAEGAFFMDDGAPAQLGRQLQDILDSTSSRGLTRASRAA